MLGGGRRAKRNWKEGERVRQLGAGGEVGSKGNRFRGGGKEPLPPFPAHGKERAKG